MAPQRSPWLYRQGSGLRASPARVCHYARVGASQLKNRSLSRAGPGHTHRKLNVDLPAYLSIRFFHIANDGLTTVVHMDMLDADKLLPAITQASKDLNLGRISPHQTSRSRSERRNSTLLAKATSSLARPPWRLCACRPSGRRAHPQFRPSVLRLRSSRAQHSWRVRKFHPKANEMQPVFGKARRSRNRSTLCRELYSAAATNVCASPSGGWTFAILPSARNTLTRTGGTRRSTSQR